MTQHRPAPPPRAGLLERAGPGGRHRRRDRAGHGARRARRGGPPRARADRPRHRRLLAPRSRSSTTGCRPRSTPASAAVCARPAAGCAPRTAAGSASRIEDSPAGGRLVVSAVNGLIGDRLAEQQDGLAITMAVRRHGARRAARPGLAGARRSRPRPRTSWSSCTAWARPTRRGSAKPGRPAAATASGWPPNLVDAGLPARQHRPADRRERRRPGLAARRPRGRRGRPPYAGSRWSGTRWAAWSCAPRARSAPTPDRPWNDLVTDVVTLGTPHLGAPLERGVALGARALGRLPESAPVRPDPGVPLRRHPRPARRARPRPPEPAARALPPRRGHARVLAPAPGQRDARRPAGALSLGDRPAAARAARCSRARTCCTSAAATSTSSTTLRCTPPCARGSAATSFTATHQERPHAAALAPQRLRRNRRPAVPVWDVVGDLTRMPEWSPELRRLRLMGRGPARVGSTLLGLNRRGWVAWPTTLDGHPPGARPGGGLAHP